MALKEAHQGASWTSWNAPLRDRQSEALAASRSRFAEAIERHAFRQFIFFRQWDTLHNARKRNIQIMGISPFLLLMIAQMCGLTRNFSSWMRRVVKQ
jgi:4-alpha-glucanotransferase